MIKSILIFLIGLVGVVTIFGQAPQAFKYQTLVRNNSGDIITNQAVSFRIGIVQDSINGAPIYSETHINTTNQFGLVSLEVGTGTVESGVFEDIGWGSATHFMKVELDETGNTNYQLMGAAQLVSVPYALQAENVTNDKDEQRFSVSGDTLFISNGNYVILPGVSPVIPFISCGDILTDIDSNTYNTVIIGNQCWMKENLKTTTYNNGTPIPNVTDNTAWGNLTTGAYALCNNNISWKDSYGALYNWYTTVDANGLCPTGWHVPTNDEWIALTDFIGGIGSPHGNELKSCRQVNSPLGSGCDTSDHPRWNLNSSRWGTNNYGFSGLPGGFRNYDGSFNYVGSYGEWWSSTENSSSNARGRDLSSYYGYVLEGNHYKLDGISVRCLRDF